MPGDSRQGMFHAVSLIRRHVLPLELPRLARANSGHNLLKVSSDAIDRRDSSSDAYATMGWAIIHRLTTVYITINVSMGYWLCVAAPWSSKMRAAARWDR